MPVTVNPKSINIGAYNQYKEYGQDTPEFSWCIDESSLIGTDSVDDFDIELTAGEGDDKYCDVGGYDIKLSEAGIIRQNPNYTVNFIGGRLNVSPILAEIQWEPVSNIKVGDQGPQAFIVNLLNNDECLLTVEYPEGTGEKGTDLPSRISEQDEPRVFTAEVTQIEGKDRFNYTLPQEDIQFDYYVGKTDASDYHMPESAELVYGQKLSEANLILASGDGEFSFVETEPSSTDIGDTVPGDVGSYRYMIKYTPNKITEAPVYAEISVNVSPKRITVNAASGEKIYGEETVLDFELDEENGAKLVGDDTKKDLDIVLTAVSTDEENTSDGDGIRSPVGVYEIQLKACGNSNYDVTVISAEFRIGRRTVKLIWPDETEFKFNGKPVNITAKAEGIIPGDECLVNIVNGDRTQPGTYYAQAVSLTNNNYELPEDSSLLLKKYSIIETSSGAGSVSNGTGSVNSGDMTGDTFVLFMILLGASFAVMLAAVIYRRRSMR